MIALDAIAAAVVARLNQGVAAEKLAPEFTAVAVDTVDFELTDGGLHVLVLGLEQELAHNRKRGADDCARDADAIDYTIEITVLKKRNTAWQDSQIAEMKGLVVGIFHFLRSTAGRLDTLPEPEAEGAAGPVDVQFFDSSIKPLYAHARLREERQFASQQRIVYRGLHDLDAEGLL